MTMGDGDTIGMDQVFDSFVKRKLQQLGIRRAAAKAKDCDAMSRLELSIKMRLEKSMAHQNLNNITPKQESTNETASDSEKNPMSDVVMFENGSKEVAEQQKQSEHRESNSKKKEKSHKKKKKSKDKKKRDSKSVRGNEESSLLVKKEAENNSKNIIDQSEKSLHITEKTSVPGGFASAQGSQNHSFAKDSSIVGSTANGSNAAPCSLYNDKLQSENSSVVLVSHEKSSSCKEKTVNQEKAVINQGDAKPMNRETTHLKKDISIIKMKVELLKARQAEEKLARERKGSLEGNTGKVMISDPNQNGKASLKIESGSNNVDALNSGPKMEDDSQSKRSRRDHRSKSRERKRSRERHKRHSKHHSRSRSYSPGHKRRRRHHHSSRSPSKHRRRRSRSHDHHKKSRRRSRSPRITAEDKIRLLEIAKANALAQHRVNLAVNSMTGIGQMVREGTMSVSQLTDLCRGIASDQTDKVIEEPLTKEKAENMLKERETSTVNHPFVVQDAPINIKPIKNIAVAPPAISKPIETLSKEFPVSCGQQHRRKEVLEAVYGKWEAVAKDEATKNAVKEIVDSKNVFLSEENPKLDLSSAIAERISAVRELQNDPNSVQAKAKIESAQKALNIWSQSKQIVGQFTGNTGLTAMPKNLLESGNSAWFNANDLKNAKPVVGIGKSLLQKMGWKPGMALGKTMPGQLEPLEVDFKMDRRGLSSFMEAPIVIPSKKPKKSTQVSLTAKDLSSKHPVSALTEVCSKRHWLPPEFTLVDPLNLTLFTFRVTVCDSEYVGLPASNKKEAKKKAAMVALQKMGLLPQT